MDVTEQIFQTSKFPNTLLFVNIPATLYQNLMKMGQI